MMTTRDQFLEEYNALVAGVGFAPLLGRTLIAVTGSEAAQFLQSFTTNDIKQLMLGAGCEAFVTSTQGRTLGHVLVFREAERFVLDTTPGQAAALIGHFERYVITEDVQFADFSEAVVAILVAGPKAAALIAKESGLELPGELYRFVEAKIGGRPVMIRRVDFAGPGSFFVQAARADADEICAELASSGATSCGAEAVNAARLEAGTPLFGLDITAENLPQEVGRDARAISFTKGCYLGQETVARIDAVGHVNRLLAGVRFDGKDIPPGGTALFAGEQEVGQVTSAVWSPRLSAPLALAYLRRSFAKPGTQLTAALGKAEVIRLSVAC